MALTTDQKSVLEILAKGTDQRDEEIVGDAMDAGAIEDTQWNEAISFVDSVRKPDLKFSSSVLVMLHAKGIREKDFGDLLYIMLWHDVHSDVVDVLASKESGAEMGDFALHQIARRIRQA